MKLATVGHAAFRANADNSIVMNSSGTNPKKLMMVCMHAVRASNADPCRMFDLAYAAWPLIAFVAQSETCSFHESMKNTVSWRSHYYSDPVRRV